MLRTLSVRNFAIIDRLDLEFGAGFNVLTGETGAGKSILMDALNLILGARAGAEMVRGGADRATIDAVFDVADAPHLLRSRGAHGLRTGRRPVVPVPRRVGKRQIVVPHRGASGDRGAVERDWATGW